jgi:hypothetical protein
MNPPSTRSGPLQQEPHGCQGDGCASAVGTWPLHRVYRSGVRTWLCNSCILLAHRSYYCCSCFFLIPLAAQWSFYEPDDPFIAPHTPIATCHVCREAVAHLACLPPSSRGTAAFVCPACSAAAEGRTFAYTTLDNERADRVLVVASRFAQVLLQRSAGVARAEAERLSQNAFTYRRRAHRALQVAMEVDTEVHQEQQSDAMLPPRIPSENRHMEVGEGNGTSANEPLLRRRRRAIPPPRILSENRRMEVGEGSETSANQPLLRPRRRAMRPPRIPSENWRMEVGEGSGTSAYAPPRVQQQRHTLPQPPLSTLTIDTDRLTQLAMAACAAARDDSNLPPPRALPLFSIPDEETDAAEASPSTTLQLFPSPHQGQVQQNQSADAAAVHGQDAG